MTKKPVKHDRGLDAQYGSILGDITSVIDAARQSAARSVNCIMTAAYWLIGCRIVEFEQCGRERAQYGEELLERLSVDLVARFGRGFSRRNLQDMRLFYLAYPLELIWQTVSAKLNPMALAACFPLPWSAYVRLLSVDNELARRFYETEALRGGWSVRQLDRQINSQFYERTALSLNKAVAAGWAMPTKMQSHTLSLLVQRKGTPKKGHPHNAGLRLPCASGPAGGSANSPFRLRHADPCIRQRRLLGCIMMGF